MKTIIRNSITLVLGLALLVPSVAAAQTAQEIQLQMLLQEDVTSLVALNGEGAVRAYLLQLLILLTQVRNDSGDFFSGNNGNNPIYTIVDGGDDNDDDDEPDVETFSARDIEEDSAELRGEVDMNNFRNGRVFFVYGEDEDEVEDAVREDEYNDIRERGDDLQKVVVDSDLDRSDDFERTVRNLDEDTRHYFALCVEYEDRRDERLECGDVEEFRTDDRNGSSFNRDEPEAQTLLARDIRDDEAELRGEVDVNEFDNGQVFFVWGENEDDVQDVDRERTYREIEEDGDELQKALVDRDLDGRDGEELYELTVDRLDDNTRHYFRICVAVALYSDADGDDDYEEVFCGDVEDFTTDR